MKRKVIQLAGKTLLVSLPHTWAAAQHIRKGQDINVEEHHDQLIISGKGVSTLNKATLEIDEQNAADEIGYLYQRGVDELTVNFSTPQAFQAIVKRTERLLGFEIIQQGKNYCIIKSIAADQEDAFQPILERTLHVLNEFAKEVHAAYAARAMARLPLLAGMEESTDKLTDYCKRILNKYPRPDGHYLYAIVRDLEKLGDHYALLCGKKRAMSTAALAYLARINDLLSLLAACLFKPSLNNLSAFSQAQRKILRQSVPDGQHAHALASIRELLCELYGPLVMLEKHEEKDA